MTPHTPQSIIALSLGLALVKSSNAPVLLLDGDLTVLAASASFCKAFQINPAAVADRPLAEVGAGEWNVRQLISLLKATATGAASVENYEMDLVRKQTAVRKLVLSAIKLDYADGANTRLILTVSDVTQARAAERLKEDMIHEKEILLKEIHHRVANSLQIIASVLIQNARTVQSEETRLHLVDAHQRVMSVASLQQQLAASGVGDVQMQSYLSNLCGSISASMISDHDNFTLDVEADQGTATAETSVSMGLIVTELVINALKHAFARHPNGKILVGYESKGLAWTLSVTDNGIGMPVGAQTRKAGLGTSIVQALARQLDASIQVSDAHPGTAVSVIHLDSPAPPDARDAV